MQRQFIAKTLWPPTSFTCPVLGSLGLNTATCKSRAAGSVIEACSTAERHLTLRQHAFEMCPAI